MALDSRQVFDRVEATAWRAAAQRQRQSGQEFIMGRRSGACIWNLEGTRKLLDCALAGGVHSLGHANNDVADVIRAALDDGLDTGQWTMPNAGQLELQQRLAELAPSPALNRSVITLSSTISVDLAVMFAFRMTGRQCIMACRHGYHGHSGFAVTVTGSEREGVREHFKLPAQFATFFDSYDDGVPEGLSQCAAVLLEPWDYETFRPISQSFMTELEAKCREAGTLLIMDETRTGLMRSGELWMNQKNNMAPDMVVCGKGLSGGLYPVSVLLVTEAVYENCMNKHEFAYISSLGGNEISARVAKRVLDLCSSPALQANVKAIETRSREVFAALVRAHNVFETGTNLGAIATLGLRSPDNANVITAALFNEGVLCHSVSTTEPHVVKFLIPVTASPDVVDVIGDAISAFAKAK